MSAAYDKKFSGKRFLNGSPVNFKNAIKEIRAGLLSSGHDENSVLVQATYEAERLHEPAATIKFDNDVVMYACSMGKVFRVTHICDTDEEANKVMESTKESALLCQDKKGRLYLAKQYGSIAPSSILKDAQGNWK